MRFFLLWALLPQSKKTRFSFSSLSFDIIKSVKNILNIKKVIKFKINKKIFHDVPDENFKGPF